MADIFLSYARPDQTSALELADELRGRGYSVWIDRNNIRGSRNWTAEIVEAINGCSMMLVLLSSNSAASHNVAKEVQLASEKRKNILPVLLERIELPPLLEYPLAGLHRVHYEDRPSIFHALDPLYGPDASPMHLEASTNNRAHESDPMLRVAVLPFDDLSPKRDNQWFADGMMDELIGTLGSLDRVKVPGRSDVLHYRDHHAVSREIARELGVRYLIEGSVRKAGERIRISATLTDTSEREQLWSNQFDGSFDDVFAFQEAVSKHIANALKLKLTPQEQERVEEHGTQNAEAYELYLKGKHEQYYCTKESYLKALEFYERAAQADSNFARAYIAVASTSCAYYREYSKAPKWLKRAEAGLAKAESIAGETARTLYIRGMIAWLKGKEETAIAALTRATILDPKYPNSYNVLGTLHLESKNYSAAAEAFQRATEISGSGMDYFNFLTALSAAGENERLRQKANEAIPIIDCYLLRHPEDHSTAVSRALILLWAGKRDESTEAAYGLLERDDLSGMALYNLGILLLELGNSKLFLSLMRRAIDHGYREIEGMRSRTFDDEDAGIESEFKTILSELETLIEAEKNVLNESLT